MSDSTSGVMSAGAAPGASERLSLPIESFETTLVDLPLVRPHRFATLSIDYQSMVIVQLRTTGGVEGIGEGVVPGGPWWGGESIEGVKALIDRYIGPLLIGEDAAQVSAVSSKLDRAIPGAQFAKAAVEMAMWDARGKALGVPLYELLGGLHRDRIEVFWALGAEPARAVIEEIEQKLAAGAHRAFKLKMGATDPAEDVARIVAIAAPLAEHARLHVDLNGSWDEATATRWAPRLQEAGISVIEQPLPAWDVRGLARLSSRLEIPLMVDESLRTHQDAVRLGCERAAALMAVKVAKCGGLLATQQIAAIGAATGIASHGGTSIESSIGTAASAHVFCATAGVSAGSELFGPLLLAADLAAEPLEFVGDCLLPPDRPGLGVTLDGEALARFARA